jgi:DME family drug/metabolite transporter
MTRDLRSFRFGTTLVGGVAVAAYQLTFFEAVDRTGVAVGTLVTIGTGPVVAGIIDGVVGRHRPTVHWFIGAGVALAGVALLPSGGADVDGVWACGTCG